MGVTSQHLLYFKQYQNNAHDNYNFPAMRIGLSWSWKQLFTVGSTTEVKLKLFENIIMQSSYASTIEWSLLKWNVHDCNV